MVIFSVLFGILRWFLVLVGLVFLVFGPIEFWFGEEEPHVLQFFGLMAVAAFLGALAVSSNRFLPRQYGTAPAPAPAAAAQPAQPAQPAQAAQAAQAANPAQQQWGPPPEAGPAGHYQPGQHQAGYQQHGYQQPGQHQAPGQQQPGQHQQPGPEAAEQPTWQSSPPPAGRVYPSSGSTHGQSPGPAQT